MTPLDPFVDMDRGRARFRVTPRAPRELPHVDGLLAGAAQVDITPPPGIPKAGYSANAHTGIGFRTRLRARAVHLRSGTTSIAIVQCDLLGGSSVLQHLVADALARADDVDVPLAGLMIGATHTHAGPGQFLGTDFYNRFASNKSGFDPAYTAFLVEQITSAVTAAVRSRRPARAAFGSTDVWGLTRNRS
ncbi:MAG: neutral ceramidase, partial [Acidimicrobiaceae bacterium]